MSHFVQIGLKHVNLDKIVSVERRQENPFVVDILYDDGKREIVDGPAAKRILDAVEDRPNVLVK